MYLDLSSGTLFKKACGKMLLLVIKELYFVNVVCSAMYRWIMHDVFPLLRMCILRACIRKIDSPTSSHSGSLSDMSSGSNGSLPKSEHKSLDFKLIVDDVKSGQQVNDAIWNTKQKLFQMGLRLHLLCIFTT